MNYTDDQLKQLLALMLPETVEIFDSGLLWRFNFNAGQNCTEVLDTELLHLCSLVEAGMMEKEWEDYAHALFNLTHPHDDCGSFEGIARAFLSATWQQRTSALAEVKGVTL